MTFQQRIKIHDEMMLFHRSFMDEAGSLKQKIPEKYHGDVDSLINLMKTLAQLVDSGLELGAEKIE